MFSSQFGPLIHNKRYLFSMLCCLFTVAESVACMEFQLRQIVSPKSFEIH